MRRAMSEAAPGEAEPATRREDTPEEPDAADVRAAIFMGVFFVGTILAALVLATPFAERVEPVFEDPEDATNSLLYLGIVVVFTIAILLIAKFVGKAVIRYIILGAILFTMVYVFEPFLAHYVPALGTTGALGLALTIALVLTLLLRFYPEWYVVDAVGVSVAAGITAVFGFSFGLFPAIILLLGFAIYDFIAVYRTKHMLDLADAVMDLRLPIMLVVPKVRGYSFLSGERLKKDEDDASRDALFMGLGDIVIPGVLVVSAFVFLAEREASAASVLGLSPHLFVALSTLLGATAGFALLMWAVLKGKPHAGLPSLNGGAFLGFFSTLAWLYGWGPVTPSF